MNISYLVYQAERQRSVTEQRESDVQAGQLAEGIAAVKAAVIRRAVGSRQQTPLIPGDDLIPELSSRR